MVLRTVQKWTWKNFCEMLDRLKLPTLFLGFGCRNWRHHAQQLLGRARICLVQRGRVEEEERLCHSWPGALLLLQLKALLRSHQALDDKVPGMTLAQCPLEAAAQAQGPKASQAFPAALGRCLQRQSQLSRRWMLAQ